MFCPSVRHLNRIVPVSASLFYQSIRRMTMLIPSNKLFRQVVSGCVAATLALAAFQVQGVQVSTQQRQAKAESRLQKEVRHVLVTQPFYTVFDNLAYKVEGDRV